MLRRIKWAGGAGEMSDSDDDDDAVDSQLEQHCKLIWEGSVLKHTFEPFRFEVAKSEAGARLFLQRRQVRVFVVFRFVTRHFDFCLRQSITGTSLEHFTLQRLVLRRLRSDVKQLSHLR